MNARRKELHSWKAIAVYLDLSVRTAQSYEKNFGLPVRRPPEGSKARVLAYTDELDAWMRQRFELGVATAPGAPVSVRHPNHRQWTRRAVFAFVLLLVSALVWSFQAGKSRPGGPFRCSVVGIALEVYDGYGKVLWAKAFPGLLSTSYARTSDPRGAADPYLVADLEGDGANEVLFNYWPADQSSDNGVLYCFESDGRIRWTFRFGRPVVWGERQFSESFFGYLIRSLKAKGKHYVVATGVHAIYFPCQVALLDAVTGELIGEYWHPGWFHDALPYDLDGDGEPELLLAGINNPGPLVGSPVLAALRLPFGLPDADRKAKADLESLSSDPESAYYAFPTPDVAMELSSTSRVRELILDPLGNLTAVINAGEHGPVFYHLDGNLCVREVQPSDAYVLNHDILWRQGLLSHAFGQQDLEDLRAVRKLPTAWANHAPSQKSEMSTD
jgi:hypothetical protein